MAKGIILLLTGSTVLLPLSAECCLCVGERPPPLVAMEHTDYVFAGIVITSEAPGSSKPIIVGTDTTWADWNSGDMVRWKIAVIAIWKGSVQDTMDVYSARTSSSCGYAFEVGEKYIIYGRTLEKRDEYYESISGIKWPSDTEFPVLRTDKCTRTKQWHKVCLKSR